MKSKTCPHCGETKPVDQFHRNPEKGRKHGRTSWCRTCVIDYIQDKRDKRKAERAAEYGIKDMPKGDTGHVGLQVRYRWIVLHHSASPHPTTAQKIREWHEKKGFGGIGYHWVIESDGTVKLGTVIQKKARACKGDGNKYGINICIAGDNTVPGSEWTQTQIESGRELIKKIRFIIPYLGIHGHNEFRPTLCPGYDQKQLRKMFDG